MGDVGGLFAVDVKRQALAGLMYGGDMGPLGQGNGIRPDLDHGAVQCCGKDDVAGCLQRADIYHLAETEARVLIDAQVHAIRDNWEEVCDLAELSKAARASFWQRQFLNPYAIEGY